MVLPTDDEEVAAADQAVQGGRAEAPNRRAGEKRSKTGEDRVERLDFIKFGSFAVASAPVGLQRWGSARGHEDVPDSTVDVAERVPSSLFALDVSASLEREEPLG